jgi:hypothetical protein
MSDGLLIFDPLAPSTPTTTFDSTFSPNGRWTTTFNPKYLSDQMFFIGNPIPVDSNITGGGTASLSYTASSTSASLAYHWQLGAALYTYWPNISGSQINTGNNAALILPSHQGDSAGTPENNAVENSLVQGPLNVNGSLSNLYGYGLTSSSKAVTCAGNVH